MSLTSRSWLISALSSVPTSTPSRSTTTRSQAASISASRCEMKSTAMPSDFSPAITSSSFSVSLSGSEDVGSSRMTRRACMVSALAISTICCWASDRRLTGGAPATGMTQMPESVAGSSGVVGTKPAARSRALNFSCRSTTCRRVFSTPTASCKRERRVDRVQAHPRSAARFQGRGLRAKAGAGGGEAGRVVDALRVHPGLELLVRLDREPAAERAAAPVSSQPALHEEHAGAVAGP